MPIERYMTHNQAPAYYRALAERLTATGSERFTTSAALAERLGRLFVDYLRNGRGTTAISTYSPRAHRGGREFRSRLGVVALIGMVNLRPVQNGPSPRRPMLKVPKRWDRSERLPAAALRAGAGVMTREPFRDWFG